MTTDFIRHRPQEYSWLGGRDSNPDSQIQSLVSYHWTTSQQEEIQCKCSPFSLSNRPNSEQGTVNRERQTVAYRLPLRLSVDRVERSRLSPKFFRDPFEFEVHISQTTVLSSLFPVHDLLFTIY
jgi:hypothetical protein